jgi:hypothetical protein
VIFRFQERNRNEIRLCRVMKIMTHVATVQMRASGRLWSWPRAGSSRAFALFENSVSRSSEHRGNINIFRHTNE